MAIIPHEEIDGSRVIDCASYATSCVHGKPMKISRIRSLVILSVLNLVDTYSLWGTLLRHRLNSSTTLLTSDCFWCLFFPDRWRKQSIREKTSLCSSNISLRQSPIFCPPPGDPTTALASSTQTSSSYIINGLLYFWRNGLGSKGVITCLKKCESTWVLTAWYLYYSLGAGRTLPLFLLRVWHTCTRI